MNSTHRTSNETLLAVSDEHGGVRLYRYPVLSNKADFINLQGHTLHVTKVQFNQGNDYLFSLGGSDRAMMQWKLGGRRTESASLATLDVGGDESTSNEKNVMEKEKKIN